MAEISFDDRYQESYCDWNTPERLLTKISESATACFPVKVADPLIVRRYKNWADKVPFAPYRRGPNGEHIIVVACDPSYWNRYVYQFAHEYCHIFSDHYVYEGHTPFRWFEECLCELASQFALKSVHEAWTASGEPALSRFVLKQSATDYIDSCEKQLIAMGLTTTDFADQDEFNRWLRKHLPTLTANSRERGLNFSIARHLLALFESDPGLWNSVELINKNAEVSKGIDDYFRRWIENSEPAKVVAQRMGLSLIHI